MVLLEIVTESISGGELEGDAPGSVDMDRVAGGAKPFRAWKSNPGRFICFGALAASKRSRRMRMRWCSLVLIPAVRPFDHSSVSALLRNVLITSQCKLCAYSCQYLAYKTEWPAAPCHRSQFAVVGTALNGPAIMPLAKID